MADWLDVRTRYGQEDAMDKIRWPGSSNLPGQPIPQDQRQPATKKSTEGKLIAFLRRQGHQVGRKRGVLTIVPKPREDD